MNKMRGDITKRQKEVLSFIYTSLKDAGFPPSFRDIKENFDFKSNQAVLDHLLALEGKSLISREGKSARGIQILQLGYATLKVNPLVPMAGSTYAGTYTETFQLQGSWIELGDVKQFSDRVYVVEVVGDSMINAGIHENDKLLVQEQQHFKSGDIVIAQTSDSTTVKRFIRQNKPPFIFLKPEKIVIKKRVCLSLAIESV